MYTGGVYYAYIFCVDIVATYVTFNQLMVVGDLVIKWK